MKRAYLKACIGFAVLLSVALAVGCATTGPPLFAAKADNPGCMPAGSTWTSERRSTGSFGSGTARITQKSLGEQTWQGRRVFAYEGSEGTLLLDSSTMKWVAFLKGGKPVFSNDPPLGWNYPIWVGQSYTEVYRTTNHMSGKTTTREIQWSVEAKEEIKVPAGTFKVFRVKNADTDGSAESTNWWSPELGIFIKSKNQRTAKHPMGAGSQEVELISYVSKR